VPGHRGGGPALDLSQGAGISVQVGSLCIQGVEVVGSAPVEPRAQVTAVRGSGGALVAQQEGGSQALDGGGDRSQRRGGGGSWDQGHRA